MESCSVMLWQTGPKHEKETQSGSSICWETNSDITNEQNRNWKLGTHEK